MDLRELRYFVAVAEERHFGRAAARLHISQPPLSRSIQRLEAELGAALFERSPAGVALTAAGEVLLAEARLLLAQADRLPQRVAGAAGPGSLTLGSIADTAHVVGPDLLATVRRRHPGVTVVLREADLTDPTAGLRAGHCDVALTRAPFTADGISWRELRRDPVGVLLRADDPLAGRDQVELAELAGRDWFQLPEGTDPVWRAFWAALGHGRPTRPGPVVRTLAECVQSVLWNGSVGLLPVGAELPDGLVVVPLAGVAASPLVVAWRAADDRQLVRSFVGMLAARFRQPPQ